VAARLAVQQVAHRRADKPAVVQQVARRVDRPVVQQVARRVDRPVER
jgi:hypothetical protein